MVVTTYLTNDNYFRLEMIQEGIREPVGGQRWGNREKEKRSLDKSTDLKFNETTCNQSF